MDPRLPYQEKVRREVLPAPHKGSAAPRESPHGTEESLVQEYVSTLTRHRTLILLSALTGVVASLLLGFGSPPVYRSRTSLEIRSLNSDFMDMHSVDPTGNNTSAEADTNLQTQIKLLQSETLIQEVTNRLLADPHPESLEKKDLFARSLRTLHLGKREVISYHDLVENAAKSVKVKPIGMTRLVEITCESYDAQFSATFCNTLTSTYEQEDLQTRITEAQKTSVWLTRQVADVRGRAEESQKKLEAAVGGNGLMLSQTTTTAGEDRLRSLQEELVKAQAARMQEEAQASVAHSANPETLPEVQDNPEHRSYELKLADLRSQVAQLMPPLTEENPKIIHLRSQIAAAEAGRLATQTSTTHREDNEYAAARRREGLLQVALNAQQAQVSSDLQKAAQVTLLRRELDSEQQLYQTLLQKVKEAGFASAMQAVTIRIVDVANPPKFAASPQLRFEAGIGLALGLLCGVGLSFYKERTDKFFHAPGEVSRFLHVPELGVIPAAKRLSAMEGTLQSPALSIRPRAQLSGGTGRSQANESAIALTRWNDNFSISAEAYRNAVFSILLSDTSKRTRSYVVSSPSSGEGKTTVTSNLGIAFSKSRLRVVLVDGDLRRPALHRAFDVENQKGLREILRGEVNLETIPAKLLAVPTSYPNISLIPAGRGSEDVVELLHSSYLGALLARLSRDFDVILIDTPPMLHMADARILSLQSDGSILVSRAGVTDRDQAATVRDLFDRDGVRLVGTILNDFDPSREGKRDYYRSYYRYQEQSAAEHVGSGI